MKDHFRDLKDHTIGEGRLGLSLENVRPGTAETKEQTISDKDGVSNLLKSEIIILNQGNNIERKV